MRAGNPLHITMRMREDVPDLRRRDRWAAIVRVMRSFRGRFDLRIVHYSVLGNHLHIIAESEGRAELVAGMQSLTTRLAKAINNACERKGRVLAGRYHVRELTTPREVWLALRYVLLNARHHYAENGVVLPPEWIDDRSTAVTFDGWKWLPDLPQKHADFGTDPARTWLLREGWRRHGLLDLDDVPGPSRARDGDPPIWDALADAA
jgi:putative transposase